MRRTEFESPRAYHLKGKHGYDSSLPDMGALFIAWVRHLRPVSTIDSVKNIHIYNLLCASLGLTPAPNDGDDRLVRAVLGR